MHSALEDKILTSTNYNELPHRIIHHNPFFQRPLVSYGVIAYCPITGRFLLVQRNNSPEFINYIRGSYRNCDLPRITQGLSQQEANEVHKLVTGVTNLPLLYRQAIGDQFITEEGYQYALERFRDSTEFMKQLLSKSTFKLENEWLLPKGRLSPGETAERCAQREFFEEAGIRLTIKQRLASHKPFIESYRGENGRIYETRCWLYIFPEEIDPPQVLDPTDEIGNRKWMTEEEAKKVLRPSKYQLLGQAKKIYEESLFWNDKEVEP